MDTSAELALWRSVDRAEGHAAHFEGLLVQRAAEARASRLRLVRATLAPPAASVIDHASRLANGLSL
jgi:hypothetical protein